MLVLQYKRKQVFQPGHYNVKQHIVTSLIEVIEPCRTSILKAV